MATMMTLDQHFADLISGKYIGEPEIMWRTIYREWQRDHVLDIIEDDGTWDAIFAATKSQDGVAMLVLCDRAEELDSSLSSLADLTRKAVRIQYPNL